MATYCGLDTATFLVDKKDHPVRSGEATLVKISVPTIEWSCGSGSPQEIRPCSKGANYIVVIRYPNKPDMEVQCIYLSD